MSIATTPRAAAPAVAPPTNGNPWGFPKLDRQVARATLRGFDGAETFLNRLIDRGIDVRVMLDRDLKAGTFPSDTVRAVELLTRARDYGIAQLDQKHLPRKLVTRLHDWAYANKSDGRLGVVPETIYRIEHATADFLDDDEGNVRDSIRSMRTNPGPSSWKAVRSSLDHAIAETYGVRDSLHSPRHVVYAAGLYSKE